MSMNPVLHSPARKDVYKRQIEAFQFRQDENTVFADEHIVEPDLSAAIILPLNEHKIPMHRGLISVRRIFIRSARRKMNTSADLFIEKRIFHRMEHIRIDTDSKFTEISGSFIGVQQCIEMCIRDR